jgi:hypothetical protein
MTEFGQEALAKQGITADRRPYASGNISYDVPADSHLADPEPRAAQGASVCKGVRAGTDEVLVRQGAGSNKRKDHLGRQLNIGGT